MWKYNYTDELYHYGVPGMKWGHRKNRSIIATRNAYKQARKEETKARVKRAFSSSTYLAGGENRRKAAINTNRIKKASAAREKAAFKAIDTQAKAAYDKKLAKTGDKAKAEKASLKVHSKAMQKGRHGSGLSGSIADAKSGGQNTRYYNHLKATKGKKYADKAEKKYMNKSVAVLAGSVAYLAGVAIYDAYRLSK